MSKIMNNVKNSMGKFKNILSNKKFLLIMVLVVIFLAVAFYVYNNYVAPKINPDFVPNREFVTDEIKEATLYFFKVDWCPYSKKALPIWKKIAKEFHGKKINNIHLTLMSIDGEKDEKSLENFEKEYLAPSNKKIDGYPSIWMIKGDDVIEYDAKPTVESLKEFINSIL